MPRLWPITLVALAAPFVLFGCTGQKLEGRWHGPFPLEDAKACVLNLYGNGRFDLACREGDDRTWTGAGDYHATAKQLAFEFRILVRRGEILRRPPTVRQRFVGKGNELDFEDGAVLRRTL